jgi:hypothetical protein
MAEYVKRVAYTREQSDLEKYFHWQKGCPDYPRMGKEAVLIFKNKPSHIPPCPKCAQLDKKKEG